MPTTQTWGALERRTREEDRAPPHLLDGGSERPQDSCGAPTVPLHPRHGGLWGQEGARER